MGVAMGVGMGVAMGVGMGVAMGVHYCPLPHHLGPIYRHVAPHTCTRCGNHGFIHVYLCMCLL